MNAIRVFKEYLPPSFVLLASIEAMVFMFSLYLGIMLGLKVGLVELRDFFELLAPQAVFFALIMLISLGIVGLYQRRLKTTRTLVMMRLTIGILLGAALLHQLSQTISVVELDPSVWFSVIMLAFMGVVLARMCFFSVVNADSRKRRVLVLGTRDRINELEHDLPLQSNEVQIIGALAIEDQGLYLNDPVDKLLKMANEMAIDEIVAGLPKSFPKEALRRCRSHGIAITEVG